MSRPAVDITGQRFTNLEAVVAIPNDEAGKARWYCLCDCGNHLITRANALRSGNTKSCGCLKRAKTSMRSRTHGCTKTRLYRAWGNMKKRCYVRTNKYWYRYGGRGIFVCEEWLESFETFKRWAIGSGYTDSLTIDRIDNDGPYSASNCRWATNKQQARNKSNTKLDLSDVKQIKKHLSRKEITQAEIGRMFGISASHVCAIKHGRIWS